MLQFFESLNDTASALQTNIWRPGFAFMERQLQHLYLDNVTANVTKATKENVLFVPHIHTVLLWLKI